MNAFKPKSLQVLYMVDLASEVVINTIKSVRQQNVVGNGLVQYSFGGAEKSMYSYTM